MTAPRPDVTIFSDASFGRAGGRGVAGWAAWIKGAGKPSLTIGGAIGGAVHDATAAETFAAVNALYVARSRGYVAAGATVMLQSDCLHALAVFVRGIPGAVESRHADGAPLSRMKKLRAADRKAVEAVKKLLAETPIRIVVRHVRGHQTGDSGRAWVNRQCDKLARRHMRAVRAGNPKGAAT